MRPIITQICNGVPGGHIHFSQANDIDNGQSEFFASNLFVQINEHGEEVTKRKESDDKIVLGYTEDGMAFQMVIDGFFGCKRLSVFSFIDDCVTPLMNEYSSMLSHQEDSTSVTHALIQKIYSLRSMYAPMADFTMSLAMTYQKNSEYFCAGFGIGDTGIVIKRVDGTIEQLVSHTEVDGFKDAFDNYSYACGIQRIIERNSIFNKKVMPGDELVAYTYIPPVLETTVETFETDNFYKGKHYKQLVNKLNLDLKNFDGQSSLFSQLLSVVKTTQNHFIEQAKTSGQAQHFGDDFTIGRIVIPNFILVNQLQIHGLILIANDGLSVYINQKKQCFLGFFNQARRYLQQAIEYKNLILKYKNDPFLSLMVVFALLSTQDNPMTQYLVQYIEFYAGCSLEEKLNVLLSIELENPKTKEWIIKNLIINPVKELSAKIIHSVNNPNDKIIFDNESTLTP
jgi:hypothetical protein